MSKEGFCDDDPMIDYIDLLKKYIHYIGEQEGMDYLTNRYGPVYISQAEWQELQRLSEEVNKEYGTDHLI